MAKKSYDISDRFSVKEGAKIKDQWDFSPAQNDMYNYKECCMPGIQVGGVTSEPKGMYDKKSMKSQSKMAKMAQDREID
jgi:hypothetical protein